MAQFCGVLAQMRCALLRRAINRTTTNLSTYTFKMDRPLQQITELKYESVSAACLPFTVFAVLRSVPCVRKQDIPRI